MVWGWGEPLKKGSGRRAKGLGGNGDRGEQPCAGRLANYCPSLRGRYDAAAWQHLKVLFRDTCKGYRRPPCYAFFLCP